MLQFQSADNFKPFLSQGYSIYITGGIHNEVVAAVSFIATTNGLYIDAIAVSHGTGAVACKLSKKSHFDETEAQRHLIERTVNASF